MSRAIWISAVLLSHWRRHPMQLATLLIGVISATALWSGVQALNREARASYDRAAAIFGGTRAATLVGRLGATLPQQLFVDLRRAGGRCRPFSKAGSRSPGDHIGCWVSSRSVAGRTRPGAGNRPSRSAIVPQPPGQTLVAPETLSELDLPAGASPEASGGVSLPPLRVQPQMVPGVLVVDIGIAQRLLNMPERVSRLLIGNRSTRVRRSKRLPAISSCWPRPMPRAIWNA